MYDCPKCGGGETFNRNKYILCLSCGATWERPKVGPSVTDLQLQVQRLQAENDKMLALLNGINNYMPPGDMSILWYRNYMAHVSNKVREFFEERQKV